MVAQLLHGSRFECGGNGQLYGTDMSALVTGHGRIGSERGRTRKTVIFALRALGDRAKNKIVSHARSVDAFGRGRTLARHSVPNSSDAVASGAMRLYWRGDYEYSFSNSFLKASFPALLAIAMVGKETDDCFIGLDLPAR